MEMRVQLHAPASLPPRKEPPISTRYDAGWDAVEKKKILTLPGIKPRSSK
jgi:hypothetical protein